MERKPVPTWNFSVVIVQNKEGKYLAVNETRQRGWWLPAGRVEPGETFEQAAHRETLEEAGIKILLKGILRVEYTASKSDSRMRVVYYAHPADDTLPKSIPDEESLGAEWVTLEEFKQKGKVPPGLRGDELIVWAKYLEAGGTVYPLSLLAKETSLPVVEKASNSN